MTPDAIRFAADGMLLSLATWLRLLGYDCAGSPRQSGRSLLEQALAENRVFLTRNTHLRDNLPAALLARAQIVPVSAERLPQQLREVVTRFALDPDQFVFTRCLDCNAPLGKTAARGRVPADVAAREHEFWSCPACGKIFWRGGHVRRSLDRLHGWLASPRASC